MSDFEINLNRNVSHAMFCFVTE